MTSNKIDSYHIVWVILFILFLFFIFSFDGKAAETKNSRIQKLSQQIRTNESDLTEQKKLLETNSVKLYETLIKLEQLDEQSVKYSDDLKLQGGKFESIESRLNREYEKQVLDTINASGFWLFIATMLVFLMPLGFVAFESGQISTAEISSASRKHLITWVIVFLVYFVIGFGLMFGESQSGFIGSTLMFLTTPDTSVFFTGELNNGISPGGFLFYQIAFAMACVMVVSVALPNHLSIITYGFIALCLGGLVYPLFGHWAWSSHLVPDNKGFLENTGFIDFAGATVIHSLAAWFSLVWVSGLERQKKTKLNTVSNHSDTPLIYSFIGVFILWFGWVGIVAGSHFQFDSVVILLILKISLSGASAGIVSALLGALWEGKNADEMSILGAVIGGFVAASAACEIIMPVEAIVIGGVAGLIYPLACWLLKKTILTKNDQKKAVGIISAHGFCGVWGTMAVAFFGSEGLYLFETDMEQLMIQMKGICAAFFFSLIAAYTSLLVYRIFAKFGNTGE